MSRDFHTMESWHQNLTAERLNELIEELNTLTPTPFNERFSINADWIGGRQYLIYNSLLKHVESELGYQLFQGEISNLADWQQQRMWGRVQGLVEFMNGLPEQVPSYLYQLNGSGQYYLSNERLIDPDGDIDVSFTIKQTGDFTATGYQVVMSQTTSTVYNQKEFFIYCDTNVVSLTVGGAVYNFYTDPSDATFRFKLIGTALTVYKNNIVAATATFTRGTYRQPSAVMAIGAGYAGYAYRTYNGFISNVLINGKSFPLTNKDDGSLQNSVPASSTILTNVNYDEANWVGTATEFSAPTFTTQPQSMVVDEGDIVSFSCEASGNPTPSVSWLKDGVSAGVSGNTYSFTTDKDDQNSVIRAQAVNSEGSVLSNSVLLTVNAYAYQPNGTSNNITGRSFEIPAGDFEITFRYKYKTKSGSQTVIGHLTNETNYFAVNGATSARLQINGVASLFTLNNALVDGETYNVSVYRTGLTIGVNFSDYAIASRSVTEAPAMPMNAILSRQYGNYSLSAVWDLLIKSGGTSILDMRLNDRSATIVDTVNGNWTLNNHDLTKWFIAPIDTLEPDLDGIEGIRYRMERAASGVNGYNYIVTGDSTRYNGYNRMLEMYTTQLNKINMPRTNNAQSGQSATRWLANLGGSTLNAALAATPDDGSKTIMEFSFGLNDYSLGLTQAEIKQVLSDCVDAYLAQKPKALVFLVSPVPTGDPTRNVMMVEIYNQLSTEKGLYLVDGNTSMIDVLGNADYYQDSTHPNSNGSLRLLNYILSEVSPSSLYNTITMDSTWLWPEPLPSPLLEKAVVAGSYNTTTGASEVSANGRRMEQVNVEPNFEINIRHQGNLNTVVFFNFDNVKVASATYDPASDATIVVPPPAVYAKINISDQGATYDALSDVPTVRYVYERVANLTMPQINVGNTINLLDIT